MPRHAAPQIAIEAKEAKESVKAQVFEVVQVIEESTRTQERLVTLVEQLHERLEVAGTDEQVGVGVKLRYGHLFSACRSIGGVFEGGFARQFGDRVTVPSKPILL